MGSNNVRSQLLTIKWVKDEIPNHCMRMLFAIRTKKTAASFNSIFLCTSRTLVSLSREVYTDVSKVRSPFNSLKGLFMLHHQVRSTRLLFCWIAVKLRCPTHCWTRAVVSISPLLPPRPQELPRSLKLRISNQFINKTLPPKATNCRFCSQRGIWCRIRPTGWVSAIWVSAPHRGDKRIVWLVRELF